MKSKFYRLAPLCLVGLLVSMSAIAAKPSAQSSTTQTSSRIAVKATFDDTGAVVSDLQGAYMDGVDGVSSYIDSHGAYFLNLPLGGSRSVYTNLNSPVNPLNAPISGILQCGGARQSWFWIKYDSTTLTNLAVGSSAPMAAQFNLITDSTGNVTKAMWGSAVGYPSDAPALQVTRTSATTWTVESSALGDQSEIQKVNKRGAFLFRADYHLPLRVFLELQ